LERSFAPLKHPLVEGEEAMRSSSHLISDFWWLPKNVSIGNLLVGVGHHREVADREEVPPPSSWYRSFDSKGCLSNIIKYYPINLIEKWKSVCKNTNIYRTLKVFDRSTVKAILLGPFLVDIDNSNGNLDAAQTVTKQVVNYLIKQLDLSPNDIRIFFSGHKGFNVEVYPQVIGLSGSLLDQIKLSSKKLDDIIAFLRKSNDIQDSTRNVVDLHGTVIDPIYGNRFGYKLKHPDIRLHNSINKWIREDGSECARRKIELTIEQLWNISATQICVASEKPALKS